MRLRRLARRLSSNKPRDPAKIADRKRDIRALMRGVVDCLAMDALKTRAALPLTFKPPKALDLTAPTTGALVIRPSARALAERDAQEGEIDASLTKKDLDLSRT